MIMCGVKCSIKTSNLLNYDEQDNKDGVSRSTTKAANVFSCACLWRCWRCKTKRRLLRVDVRCRKGETEWAQGPAFIAKGPRWAWSADNPPILADCLLSLAGTVLFREGHVLQLSKHHTGVLDSDRFMSLCCGISQLGYYFIIKQNCWSFYRPCPH